MKKYSKEQARLLQEEKHLINPSFFYRPAEVVAPDLIGSILVKKMPNGNLLSGVIIETEAYSQIEPGCHGFKKKTQRNQTLFGEPGNLYVYLTYGTYHCINIVTDKADWASGVLLRAIRMPGEDQRIASGPGLLARRFDINISHDNLPISIENGFWLVQKEKSFEKMNEIIKTTRIGISEGKDIPWRWYLKENRSVSKRAKGDKNPLSSKKLITPYGTY